MADNEFWNSLLTEKSWKILQDLRKEYNFILIGGWAVYLLTKQKKSKDIDIVASLKELEKFKNEDLRKNERLKKYEIKRGDIDIDIYTEYYSRLAIPTEDINKFTEEVEGFVIAIPELMVLLKQAAFREREFSVKGEKDKIDIVSLIFFTNINFKKYYGLLQKYKIQAYLEDLMRLLKEFKDYNAVNLSPREFKIKKNKILEELKKI